MQTLFEWDFNHLTEESIIEALERNAQEFAPGVGDFSFMKDLIQGILGKKTDLDKVIEKAAPDWPLDKISLVDRNILRLGLYELLFADRSEVPPKVAINEAIELAKSFGGETSSKFVNGVLGAVYKELGEPGKFEKSNKDKKASLHLPDDKLPVENLVGAVVFGSDGTDDIYLALVHDIFGHWTLSKGHIEDGEDTEVGVVRVIKDELGLPVTVKERLKDNEYTTYDPEKGKIKKRVMYFLAEAPFDEIKLKESGGLDSAAWFRLRDILDLNFYNDILPIITKAIDILVKKEKIGTKES